MERTHLVGFVKVAAGLAVATEEEIRDAALEVCDGEMGVELGGLAVGSDGVFMGAEGRVNEADVEEDLG
jgi:hypothetical protein